MGIQGCSKCLKITLIVVNALVMLAGAAAIGVGAWLMTSKYGPEKLKDLSFNGYQYALSTTIIVGGCLIFLLSFLGCCGAFSENRCALGTFGGAMMLIFILFVAAIIVAYVFRNDMKKKFGEELEKVIKDKYGSGIKNDGIVTLIDFLQTELKCCGVSGDKFGSNSYKLWLSSNWKIMNLALVPKSCCAPKLDVTTCQTSVVKNFLSTDDTDSTGLYTTGCVDKLWEVIKKNIAIIGGVGGTILFIILLSAIFSFAVCSSIDSPNFVA